MNNEQINGGYILLSRKIIESEIFKKPPLYLKVWIYLLSCAQHKDYKNLKKGQLYTSIPDIQNACSHMIGFRKETPTKDQIYNVLEWLRKRCESQHESNEDTTMITTTKATHGMLVNIDKYCVYQNPKNYESNNVPNVEKDMKAEREQRQPDNINKNDKNDKNINNNPSHSVPAYQKRYEDDSFEVKCVKYLINSVISELPNAKVPNTDKSIDDWCDHIEKMKRLDKRSETDIWSTLLYATSDSFWKSNIRSTKKLRDKYETLFLQSKNKKNIKPQTQTTNKFNKFPQRVYSQDDYSSLEQKLLNRS